MAGNYPNGPARRFAYDADGTGVMFYDSVAGSVGDYRIPYWMSSAQTAWMNDEKMRRFSGDQGNLDMPQYHGDDGTRKLVFLFPEPRDIEGVFYSKDEDTFNTGVGAMQGSDDTTNGQDGTWGNIITNVLELTVDTYPNYRTVGNIGTASAQTAVQFVLSAPTAGGSDWLNTVHLYGSIPLTETPDRIIFLDADLGADTEFVKPLDFEDTERGDLEDNIQRLSLKNNSATLDATTVQVTCEDLYLDLGGMIEFSETDGSYQGTLSITSIAADTEKQIYMKKSLSATEVLGSQTGRIKISVTSWA